MVVDYSTFWKLVIVVITSIGRKKVVNVNSLVQYHYQRLRWRVTKSLECKDALRTAEGQRSLCREGVGEGLQEECLIACSNSLVDQRTGSGEPP